MSDKVIVNKKQCELIAKRILPLRFRKNHFKRPFLTFKSDQETKLRSFLFATAICHQTRTLINKKKNLKGWCYLEDVFTSLGKSKSSILKPEYLAKLSPRKLSEKLKPLFAEDGNPAHCTLDRLKERSIFLIQIAKLLLKKYDGKVENIIKFSESFLIKNQHGLYKLLSELKAFSDPLRKKSTVFIQLATNAKLLQIKDPESIEPVMDYHMQRLLLRTGCIKVVDTKLKKSLQNKTKLNSDEDIRKSSIKAIRIISEFSKKDFLVINDILWSIGRSCCKEKTLCTDKICNKKPCTFFSTMEISNHKKCIFDGICIGSKNALYRTYWEPIVDTHYY
jgi:hypothetical protein